MKILAQIKKDLGVPVVSDIHETIQVEKAAEVLDILQIPAFLWTTSGFYGVVIDITDEDVIVEFGSNKNCRIPMRKSAIAEVEKADAE